MGAHQRAAIEQAISEACQKVHSPGGQEPALCATLTARNGAGVDVWIQVMAGTVNMDYPFPDEPVAHLQRKDAFGPLKPGLIDWEASTYATWNTTGIAPRDVAFFVDRIFTKVLACADATYEPKVTLEDLDA